MRCRKCGHENKDGSIFCETCGQRIENDSTIEHTSKNHTENKSYNKNAGIETNFNQYSNTQDKYYKAENIDIRKNSGTKKKTIQIIVGIIALILIGSGIGYKYLKSGNSIDTDYGEVKSEEKVSKKREKKRLLDDIFLCYESVRNKDKSQWERSTYLLSDPKIKDILFSSLEKSGTDLDSFNILKNDYADSEAKELLRDVDIVLKKGIATLKSTGEKFDYSYISLEDEDKEKQYMIGKHYDFFMADEKGNYRQILKESRLLIEGKDLKTITFEYLDDIDAYDNETYTEDDLKRVTLDLKQYLVDTSNQPYLSRIGYDTGGRDLYVVPFCSIGDNMPLALKSISIVSKTGEEKIIDGEFANIEASLSNPCHYYDFDRGLLNENDILSKIVDSEIVSRIYESMDYSYIDDINKLLGENYIQSIILEQIKYILLIKDNPDYNGLLSIVLPNINLDDLIDLGEEREVNRISPKVLFPVKE